MSTGMPLASTKSQLVEAVLGFLPDWVRITVLALIAPAVVASWLIGPKHRIARRRVARSGVPVQAPAQHGLGVGADHLGPCAPPRPQPSGADFLGSYAPRQGRGSGSARVRPSVRWTGGRAGRPDVGGSEVADRGPRTRTRRRRTQRRRVRIPGREH
ncbi:hypothetical protein [Streptomyces flaveolus]|uniref:hypothetical protein n=1 Tax=Streptomyces flaveolus TaxID=67297 RepID=UPI0033C2D947